MAGVASDKLGDAKNLASEKGNEAMDAAADIAHRATERGKHGAYGAYEFASEKAGNAIQWLIVYKLLNFLDTRDASVVAKHSDYVKPHVRVKSWV